MERICQTRGCARDNVFTFWFCSDYDGSLLIRKDRRKCCKTHISFHSEGLPAFKL